MRHADTRESRELVLLVLSPLLHYPTHVLMRTSCLHESEKEREKERKREREREREREGIRLRCRLRVCVCVHIETGMQLPT